MEDFRTKKRNKNKDFMHKTNVFIMILSVVLLVFLIVVALTLHIEISTTYKVIIGVAIASNFLMAWQNDRRLK